MPIKYLDLTPPPLQDKVIRTDGLLTDIWLRWFGRLPATLGAIPSIVNTVTLATQGASVSATDFSGTRLLVGTYRATYHAQITQAATTSSSLTVTIGWTDGAVAQSISGAPIIGNTTATGQSGGALIHVDAATAVNYSTSYSSTGATAMQYSLNLLLERIKV